MSSQGQPPGSPTQENRGEGNQDGQKKLRSSQSRTYSFIRLRNMTERKAKVIWMNYEGQQVNYHNLQPQGFLDINTFVGHPWVFRDADTGDMLVAGGQEVFEPIGFKLSDGWPPQRREVKIHIPVYGLVERCLQVLRDTTSSQMLDQMNIPPLLKREIQEALVSKRRQNNPS